MRFDLAPLPEAEPILARRVRAGSTIACWSVASVAPMVALDDEDAVIAAADGLADALAATVPAIDARIAGEAPRSWVPLSRAAARRAILNPLRFSMAYRGEPRLGDLATIAVDAFLARFGEDARFLTAQEGFSDLLGIGGHEEALGGYSCNFMLTSATFELAVAAVDWERAGLFVATDED